MEFGLWVFFDGGCSRSVHIITQANSRLLEFNWNSTGIQSINGIACISTDPLYIIANSWLRVVTYTLYTHFEKISLKIARQTQTNSIFLIQRKRTWAWTHHDRFQVVCVKAVWNYFAYRTNATNGIASWSPAVSCRRKRGCSRASHFVLCPLFWCLKSLRHVISMSIHLIQFNSVNTHIVPVRGVKCDTPNQLILRIVCCWPFHFVHTGSELYCLCIFFCTCVISCDVVIEWSSCFQICQFVKWLMIWNTLVTFVPNFNLSDLFQEFNVD